RDLIVTGVQTCALPIYRIELASRQRRPVTVNIAAPAQFVFSLFIVFALAKLLVILDRHLAFSPLVVFALLGQDALFAVAAGLLRSEERRVGKEWRAWGS